MLPAVPAAHPRAGAAAGGPAGRGGAPGRLPARGLQPQREKYGPAASVCSCGVIRAGRYQPMGHRNSLSKVNVIPIQHTEFCFRVVYYILSCFFSILPQSSLC